VACRRLVHAQSITEYNGSGLLAMVGKNCVAIASDTRFGNQQQTVATDFNRIQKITDKCYVGLSGLITDVQTLFQLFRFRSKLYALREDREIRATVFANLVSTLMYEKRFGPYFCEPLIAGLDKVKDEKTGEIKENVPFISAMDLIGAEVTAKDFVVGGTSSEELFGVCESFFRPDLEPDELFEVASQCLLAAVDRDCLAGWGAVVHVITADGCTTRHLKARMD